ncbi:MAG: phosphoribosylpyrophosphate synthetase [Bdellovibrionota bacterium]
MQHPFGSKHPKESGKGRGNQHQPGTMETMIERIAKLREQGYTEDFNLKKDHLESRNGQTTLFHNDFKVDRVFRFDEDSDPAAQSILYAVSSCTSDLKGILIDGYGTFSSDTDDEMVKKLREKN